MVALAISVISLPQDPLNTFILKYIYINILGIIYLTYGGCMFIQLCTPFHNLDFDK